MHTVLRLPAVLLVLIIIPLYSTYKSCYHLVIFIKQHIILHNGQPHTPTHLHIYTMIERTTSRPNRMTISTLSLLVVALVVMATSVSASSSHTMPKENKFEAPSKNVRGALKKAIDHDFEDIIVMQTEIAWGANEMSKYKTIRGDWPVRSNFVHEEYENPKSRSSNEGRGAAADDEDFLNVPRTRGGAAAAANSVAAPEADYWSYLISIF